MHCLWQGWRVGDHRISSVRVLHRPLAAHGRLQFGDDGERPLVVVAHAFPVPWLVFSSLQCVSTISSTVAITFSPAH